MTLPELYGWAAAHSLPIFAVLAAVPVAGTAAAWIGKGGRTDADGRTIANVLIGFAVLLFLAELLVLIGVHWVVGRERGLGWILDADALLLVGPVACLVGCVLGLRLVFPLNELASVRSLYDVAGLAAAVAVAAWFFSQFRGWGIIFFGSVFQLLILLAVGFFILRRLWRRATGAHRSAS